MSELWWLPSIELSLDLRYQPFRLLFYFFTCSESLLDVLGVLTNPHQVHSHPARLKRLDDQMLEAQKVSVRWFSDDNRVVSCFSWTFRAG